MRLLRPSVLALAASGAVLVALPLPAQAIASALLVAQKRWRTHRLLGLASLAFALPLCIASWIPEQFPIHCTMPLPAPRTSTAGPLRWFPATPRTDCERPGAYRYDFSIDALGRREGAPQSATGASDVLLAAGCSFTFGVGVNNEETLPARIEAQSRGSWRALNLGFPGGGLQHATAVVLHWRSLAPELGRARHAVFLYTMLADHLLRLDPEGWMRMPNLGWNPAYSPDRLDFIEDVALRPSLRFLRWKLGYTLYGKLANGLAQAEVRRHQRAPVTSETEINRFREQLNSTARRFYADFPDGLFIVNLWPQMYSPLSEAARRALIGLDRRVIVLSYPFPKELSNVGGSRSVDGHPAPLSHDRMAAFLLREIDLRIRRSPNL